MTGISRMISLLQTDPGNPPVEYDVAQVSAVGTRVLTLQLVGQSGTVSNCPLLDISYKATVGEYVWVINRAGGVPIVMGPVTPVNSKKRIAGGYANVGVDAGGNMTIPHGLGYTPDWAVVTPGGNSSLPDALLKPNVWGMDATNVYCAGYRTDTAPGTLASNPASVWWCAGSNY